MTDARATHEYWPTPPCAAIALREWLRDRRMLEHMHGVVDPFAGPGLLLEHFPGIARAAIEIDTRWEPHLRARCGERRGDSVVMADAFSVSWPAPAYAAIVTNPPFSRAKDAVLRALEWVRENGRWAAFLLRTGWLQAADRLDVPLPGFLNLLTWRPSFDGSGSTDTYAYAWMVWDAAAARNEGLCCVVRLRRPDVPVAARDRHRRLASMACAPTPQQAALEV